MIGSLVALGGIVVGVLLCPLVYRLGYRRAWRHASLIVDEQRKASDAQYKAFRAELTALWMDSARVAKRRGVA